jgi:hypothetical protein
MRSGGGIALDEGSAPWPCDLPGADQVKLKVAESGAGPDGGWPGPEKGAKILVADSNLEPSEVQDLGDTIPQLLEIKSKANTPLAFRVRIEVGDGESEPDTESTTAISTMLEGIREDFKLK